jgi:hypothetical protein
VTVDINLPTTSPYIEVGDNALLPADVGDLDSDLDEA